MPQMTHRELLLESIAQQEHDYQMAYITLGELVRTVDALVDAYQRRLAYEVAQKGADDASASFPATT